MLQTHKAKRIFKYIRYSIDALRLLFNGQRDFVRINGTRYGQLMGRTHAQAMLREKSVIFYDEPIANRFALKKWSEVLAVNQGGWVLWRISERFGWPKIRVEARTEENGFSRVNSSDSEPFIKFSQEEESRGWALLREKGINLNDEIICVHTRDEAYMKKWQPDASHTFRKIRNTDSDILIKSIEYLIGEGFKVVRIGSEAEKRIPIESDQFWDYAMDDHDEFMDLFLMSVSKCLIATCAGVTMAAMAFGKPCLLFDHFPIMTEMYNSRKRILVPKKIYIGKRMLSWSEMIDVKGRSADIIPTEEDLARQGLRLEGVSADELLKFVTVFINDHNLCPAVRMLPNGTGANMAVLEQFIQDNPKLL